ncbi:MAG: Trk family potassium uptake protein [Oscillospiraceae bacterium]|nr:Trk family potassium uptake protein [Oscillospiraceae bacterium]
MPVRRRLRLSSFQIILLGFLVVILLGAALLMLPAATRARRSTGALDALFTATSALCVTGLVVRDTATHWSVFGKVVILLLIQIGGLGVVTTATALSGLSGRQIGLRQRSVLQESVAAQQLGGILSYTRFILCATLVLEALGALALFPVFAGEYGARKGACVSVFHAVSAFCNAGFDLMGEREAFSSLSAYRADAVVNAVVMALIVLGGIGFRTLDDLRRHRLQLRRYRLQSKLCLAVSAVLILLPALWYYCFELGGLSGGERVLAALFQSVTTRTAGFNTVDYGAMSEAGQLLTIALMLVGGSPGSTAGGMKTTTLAVLLLYAAAVFRRGGQGSAFGRRLPTETLRAASAILVAYLTLFLGVSCVMSRVEGLPLLATMFETASAIGTVGLTLGLTPQLGALSRGMLIFLMYFGRVGGLTLIFAALPKPDGHTARLPEEAVSVG